MKRKMHIGGILQMMAAMSLLTRPGVAPRRKLRRELPRGPEDDARLLAAQERRAVRAAKRFANHQRCMANYYRSAV